LKPKPAPDEIIKAEKLLKQKADYMVGDTVYDIIAARKAKVKSIGVTSGLQDYNKLKTENPHKILKSVKDLPKFLKL
jgi:phosphoglycolate phosphatase-like HAD superfamily hydrolase